MYHRHGDGGGLLHILSCSINLWAYVVWQNLWQGYCESRIRKDVTESECGPVKIMYREELKKTMKNLYRFSLTPLGW